MRPGPYPEGTTPDQVFFRTDAGVDAEGRRCIRDARRRPGRPTCSTSSSSARRGRRLSPLGDPVPFSAYLIGRLVNPTGYSTQFNLDADRAYAYLTWDWIRGDERRHGPTMGFQYQLPVAAPWLDRDRWDQGDSADAAALRRPAAAPVIIESPRDDADRAATDGPDDDDADLGGES